MCDSKLRTQGAMASAIQGKYINHISEFGWVLSSKLLILVLVVTQPTTLPNSYVPNEISTVSVLYYLLLSIGSRPSNLNLSSTTIIVQSSSSSRAA